MRVEPLSFYELMRTSHISRWHVVNTSKGQNLAEHQYNVAVIGMELYRAYTGEEITARFIAALLFHDSAEIRYGDVPTPGKAFMRQFTNQPDLFEKMDTAIMPSIPFFKDEVSWGLGPIIKLADLIEAAWWISENGVGAHARFVADKCRQQMREFIHDNNYHEIANPVLIDLGMMPVSRSERTTPP
jgi:5'-deoxynucleotidase YfbR-like HD superfamily hydrolase